MDISKNIIEKYIEHKFNKKCDSIYVISNVSNRIYVNITFKNDTPNKTMLPEFFPLLYILDYKSLSKYLRTCKLKEFYEFQ